MAFVDEKTPNVSAHLRKRIGTRSDSVAIVSLRRSLAQPHARLKNFTTLVLRNVGLSSRADGLLTPAAAEMPIHFAKRGLDPAPFALERWDRNQAEEHRRNQRCASIGMAQMMTTASRRFYQGAPLTQ